jgi:hypothetical protein
MTGPPAGENYHIRQGTAKVEVKTNGGYAPEEKCGWQCSTAGAKYAISLDWHVMDGRIRHKQLKKDKYKLLML